MPQEFLASFAVDIDEGGVNRLQRILEQNRELAEKLASAFDAARSSMESFIQSASQDLTELPFFNVENPVAEAFGNSGTFAIDLNFDNASKQLENFLTGAKKQLRLSADGSGIVSAVSSAISQARSMLAGANLKLVVKTETEKPDLNQGAGPVRYLSTGGRFSSPTKAEIAEDGETEYVIPVQKEKEAVPLIRSLLSEISDSARTSLLNAFVQSPSESEIARNTSENESEAIVNSSRQSVGAEETIPLIRELLSTFSAPARKTLNETASQVSVESGKDDRFFEAMIPLFQIPSMMSAALNAGDPQIAPNITSNNVSAPVSIRVEASSADPEKIGKSIYDTAEHYLLRTLQGVNA